MAQFHFVEDYENVVKDLLSKMPRKEALEGAVSGNFEFFGPLETEIMRYAGLRDGMFLVDLGCGSGRGSSYFGQSFKIEFLGLDVVQDLLDYAAEISPANYRFLLNTTLNIPADSGTVDMFCGFSIFTHLLHAETYLYLEDMVRCLKTGGRIVFSFLEFSESYHWDTFQVTVNDQRNSSNPHLNMFIERSTIATWCEHLGLRIVEFIDGTDTRWPHGHMLGQSIVILEKP